MFGYQHSENLEEGINSQNSICKLSSKCFQCSCFPTWAAGSSVQALSDLPSKDPASHLSVKRWRCTGRLTSSFSSFSLPLSPGQMACCLVLGTIFSFSVSFILVLLATLGLSQKHPECSLGFNSLESYLHVISIAYSHYCSVWDHALQAFRCSFNGIGGGSRAQLHL